MRRDELREIEKSTGTKGNVNPGLIADGTLSQRTLDSSCTSMFIEDDTYYGDSFNDSTEMSWQSSTTSMEQTNATQKNGDPSGPRRNSVFMSAAGMAGLLDVNFDDSDDDDDDDDDDDGNPGPPKGPPPSGEKSNQNYRPMVGGFAAAAYEAARADRYKKQHSKKPSSVPASNGGQPPSIYE